MDFYDQRGTLTERTYIFYVYHGEKLVYRETCRLHDPNGRISTVARVHAEALSARWFKRCRTWRNFNPRVYVEIRCAEPVCHLLSRSRNRRFAYDRRLYDEMELS